MTIIIGQDNFNLISSLQIKFGPANTPSAVKFKHGWARSGPHTRTTKHHNSIHYVTMFSETCLDRDNSIFDEVAYWWNAVSLSTYKEKPQSAEDKRANEILRETCCRLPGGRYETGLLWAKDSSSPNNEPLARTHPRHLLVRLRREPKMYSKYD